MTRTEEITVTHKGVTLTLSNDVWRGEYKGTTIYEEKLSVAKKRIDKMDQFKPTRLQALKRGRDGAMLVEITSYDGHKPRISYRDDTGSSCRDTVYDSDLYDNTPENIAIFEQMRPLWKEGSRISRELSVLQGKLSQKIVKEHSRVTRDAMAGREQS